MTPAADKAWLARFGDMPDGELRTCRHGHAECSTEPGGECLDDAIRDAINPDAAPPADVDD